MLTVCTRTGICDCINKHVTAYHRFEKKVSKLRSSGEYRYSNHQMKYCIYFSRYILPLVYNICQFTAERNFSHTTKIAGNHWLSEEISEINAPLTAKGRGFLCKY